MQDAFAYCAELVRSADRDRFIASLFAPAERRGALHALYAFSAEIARVREVAHTALPGEIRMQWWTDVVNRERDGEASANPVAAALLATMEQYHLRREVLLDLIEARRFDLYEDPMGTLDDLEAYLRRTSSSVISLAALDPGRCGIRGGGCAGRHRLRSCPNSSRLPSSCRAAPTLPPHGNFGAASGALARCICWTLFAGACGRVRRVAQYRTPPSDDGRARTKGTAARSHSGFAAACRGPPLARPLGAQRSICADRACAVAAAMADLARGAQSGADRRLRSMIRKSRDSRFSRADHAPPKSNRGVRMRSDRADCAVPKQCGRRARARCRS